jgi:hypothetical protein
MQQPIQNRRREDLGAEDGAPLRDKLIGGDEQTVPLVSARD